MEKKILVVDDTQEFREVGATTYREPIEIGLGEYVRFNATFVATPDEALEQLTNGYDGVITDLFMPATIDHRETLASRLHSSYCDQLTTDSQRDMYGAVANAIEGRGLREVKEKMDLPKFMKSIFFNEKDRIEYVLKSLTPEVDDFSPQFNGELDKKLLEIARHAYNLENLPENPSGLAVAEAYMVNNIPVRILSETSRENERHTGNMGVVRNAVGYDRTLCDLQKASDDPLPSMLVGGGIVHRVNGAFHYWSKGDAQTWREAAKELYRSMKK